MQKDLKVVSNNIPDNIKKAQESIKIEFSRLSRSIKENNAKLEVLQKLRKLFK